MQRRAASLYAAFFLVLALGSYGMIAVATQPTISIANPAHQVSDGGHLTVAGRQYTAKIGSGGSGSLAWTNQSATLTTSWDNGSSVVLQGTNYSIDLSSGDTIQLTEVQPLGNVSTTTLNGTDYVVLGQGQNRTLVPVATYRNQRYGPPKTRSLTTGDTFNFDGNQTTVTQVTNTSADLAWTGPKQETVDVNEGSVIDLNGVTFVAHFEQSQLLLDRNVKDYQHQAAVVDNFKQRTDGLWGVVYLSLLATIILLALSYLPSRY